MLGYRRFRRLLFRIFVLAFLVTGSLVLFHALGYRYSFERGIFVYSGSITLNTIPETVTVTIDGAPVPEQNLGLLNNSIHITGLMPGEHRLEVSAPGYQTWTKRAIVSSGISTEFWNVILPQTTPPIGTLPDTHSVVKVFPEPNGERLALVKVVDRETSVVIYDRRTGVSRQVFATLRYTFEHQVLSGIEWSPDGRRLILPLLDHDQPQSMLVDIESGASTLLQDVTSLSNIRDLRWDNALRDSLLFRSDNSLYRLRLGNSHAPELLQERVSAFTLSGDSLYFLDTETRAVWRFESSASTVSATQTTPTLPFLPGTLAAFIAYDEERLVLLERDGARRLFVFNQGEEGDPAFREIASHVTGLQFSNDGKKLLYFSQNELHAYFTRAWEVQPERFENEIIQIARFSDPVSQVQWTEDYEHILFVQGGALKLIELDHRDRRVIHNLATLNAPPHQVLSLFDANLLLSVHPDSDLAVITFPEPQGLFGE